MNKKVEPKKVQEIREQIRKLENELWNMGFDEVEENLENQIAFEEGELDTLIESLEHHEKEVRSFKKAIPKQEKLIAKLKTQLEKRQAKKPKARK